MDDLRHWLKKIDQAKQLKTIIGASWELEIGCLSALNARQPDCPGLLFDHIKDYPAGFRILTCAVTNPGRLALTLNLPINLTSSQLYDTLQEKFLFWESTQSKFIPQTVKSVPLLENVYSGDEVDLLKLPVPQWHELDGGRYVGTGCAVITQDPDTGQVNLGTYRIMVHDKKTTGLYIGGDHHGKIHYQKYHARKKACPVAISIGHHPLFLVLAGAEVPHGPYSEYHFGGAIVGAPINVFKEETTGLPVPADSEIVIAGWCPHDQARLEGPFGEYTGYYASGGRPLPVIQVERIYHRNDPVMVGAPPYRAPNDYSLFLNMFRSVSLHNQLVQSGIPDVRRAWFNDVGQQALIIMSIKQRYAGHAKQAVALASQILPIPSGRYAVVVDEDIDPANTQEVLWALCTRSDPEKSIDIIRRCWSSPLDPMTHRPGGGGFQTSRALIDACKPYEWKDEFPKEISISSELVRRVREKWDYTI